MKKKESILVITSTYPRWKGDSTPTFVAEFCRRISRGFSEVHVLAPHSAGAKTKETEGDVHVKRYRYFYPAKSQNITYDGGGVPKISMNPVYVLKLVALVSSLLITTLRTSVVKNVSVVSAHWILPQGFVAVLTKLMAGKKAVLTVHGSDISGLTSGFLTQFKRFTLKHSDIVCVNSNATKAACREVYQREYVVIPMGVDTEVFKPKAKSKELTKKYDLNSFTALFVGRLADVKGVIYLCKALKTVKENGREFKALIAGDGPLRGELEEYVKSNGLTQNVIFTGWIDQAKLNDYYSVADVFVGPSLSEAQGIVFIESLATGTPVIASRVGGVPDVVSDEKNGFLVPPESSKDIAEKLELLIDDAGLRGKLRNNARKGVEERFSWDSVAARYLEVLGVGK